MHGKFPASSSIKTRAIERLTESLSAERELCFGMMGNAEPGSQASDARHSWQSAMISSSRSRPFLDRQSNSLIDELVPLLGHENSLLRELGNAPRKPAGLLVFSGR